ncbi:hypothetical protein ACFOU0_10930 [Salinicoccus sesuvii]|uniref:Phenylacetate-CoA ligase n=1 Tax=Salinicoccus sesuvii TaxID=868281 RepID=A0ABV7N734_9STAP
MTAIKLRNKVMRMIRKSIDAASRRIYYKSPVVIQHALTSAYGYKLKRERYGDNYYKALDMYTNKESDDHQALIDFMHHLKTHIPVYKNIDVDEADILNSFLKLPKTTKSQLRYELDARSYKKGQIRFSGTSGTTGASLAVYDSEYDRAKRMAYLDYIKRRNGVEPFSRRASFSGQELTPPNHRNHLWRYNLAMNQLLYASYHLSPKNISDVYKSLAHFRPLSIDGFPSAIHMVAKYILANNITIDWQVESIFPNAETLLPQMKRDIELAFHTTVVDQYASGEGAPFIYSIADGTYELGRETGIFEFEKVERNIYEMVVTSLINTATPIVRYRIGDHVEIHSDRPYLNSFSDDIRITRIIGRQADYLLGSNHNRVSSVAMARVVEGIEDKVKSFQFVQKDLTHFIVNMVIDRGYDEKTERLFTNRVRRRLGINNHYQFNYLDSMPHEKSGKVRFIINELGIDHA